MKTFPINNSWNDILVDVFEDNNIVIELEDNNTKTLLVEKEINQLEIAWLKEREEYKLTDGLGNTFFPDKDFTYRMTICVLQSLIGLLLYCTFMKDIIFIEMISIDDFLAMSPRLRSALISSLITFIFIIFSFLYTFRKMIKSKKRYDKGKEEYLNRKNHLLSNGEIISSRF